MASFPELEHRELPNPPPLKKALGVGVVVMGLAIGTGELILWPHLVVKHGLSILWLGLAGILFQYVINHEVARHEVATGEGFFTTSARILKWSPVFWLFSALLLYIWPGWASALGTILAELAGGGSYLIWAWASLAMVLVLTFSGKIAYEMLERSLRITVPTFFVLLVVISFMNIDASVWREAFIGLTRVGYFPANADINVLLGALVFAGAGGMLNLCVSLWYRDKGFGMGAYAGRITNPVTGRPEAVSPLGATFDTRPSEALTRWKGWMRYVRLDQGVIFAALGFVTLFLLSVNAYAVLHPIGVVPEGISVAVTQAEIFRAQWGVFGERLFLVMAFLMLFSVMWTVLDALARIVSDIIHTNSRMGPLVPVFRHFAPLSVHTLYYACIVLVVFVSALLIPLKQPLSWLVLSGVFGGITMALYTPLLLIVNNKFLPKPLRPGLAANIALVLISCFFIFFSYRIIAQYF